MLSKNVNLLRWQLWTLLKCDTFPSTSQIAWNVYIDEELELYIKKKKNGKYQIVGAKVYQLAFTFLIRLAIFTCNYWKYFQELKQ